MVALIIVAFAAVFIGLVLSLVALFISEKKALNGSNENGWVEPFGEEAISFDTRLENFIMEEQSKNNGTSRLHRTEDYGPVVDMFSSSMLRDFTKERRHENMVLSLN